jgi:hypothetical protein
VASGQWRSVNMNSSTKSTLVTTFVAPKVLILNKMETRTHTHLYYMKVQIRTTILHSDTSYSFVDQILNL